MILRVYVTGPVSLGGAKCKPGYPCPEPGCNRMLAKLKKCNILQILGCLYRHDLSNYRRGLDL
jgi:hypothetical protein